MSSVNKTNFIKLLIFSCIFIYIAVLFAPLLYIFGKGFSFNNFLKILANNSYLSVIFTTLKISFIVTSICLVFSYPLAGVLFSASGFYAKVLLFIYSSPLLINPLALLYAWLVILQKKGLINFLVVDLFKISKQPLSFLYNDIGVIIPMIYLLIPYSILFTYLSLSSIDKRLINTAKNLGATKIQTFTKVILPLTYQGAILGSILIFILGIGYFVVPSIFGSLDQTMLSMIIEQRMNTIGDWETASSLSLLIVLVIFFFLYISFKLFSKKAYINLIR